MWRKKGGGGGGVPKVNGHVVEYRSCVWVGKGEGAVELLEDRRKMTSWSPGRGTG